MGYLKSIGFHIMESDKCIFISRKVIMEIYIDNLIDFEADLESTKKVKRLFKKQFKMKDKE